MALNVKKFSQETPLSYGEISPSTIVALLKPVGSGYNNGIIELSQFFLGTNNITTDIKFNNNTLYIKSGKVGINKEPVASLDIFGTLAVSANTSIGSNLSVTGNTNITHSVSVGDNATISGNTNVNIIHSTRATKKESFLEIIDVIYPVGSLYTSTSSTNPGTTFGVGTWVAYGEGKVLVGKATSGTFGTAGATGGVETVTLTSAQSGLPAHNHTLTDPGHVHSFVDYYYSEAHSSISSGQEGSADTDHDNGPKTNFTHNTNTSSTGITIADNTAENASAAHTNLQPYVVVYMWTRTA